MKKIIYITGLAVLFLASFGQASAAWNTYPSDCPNPLSIGNYTTGEGIQDGSNGCWTKKSVSADAGQTINVAVFYDNTNTTNADNVFIKINQSPAGSMTSKNSSYSFSGNLTSSSVSSLALSQVTVNLSSSQTLTFSRAKWYKKSDTVGISLPNGQTGYEAFNGGLSMGTIAKDDWGTILFSFSVGTTVTPPATCTISSFSASPSTIDSGSYSTLSWNTSNCNSVSITNTGSSLGTSGNYIVNPQSTTTYILNASGSNNSDSKTVKVTVNQPQLNVMKGSLTANPTSCTIPKNASSCQVSLTWNTTNPQATSRVTLIDRTVVFTGNSDTKNISVSNGYKTYYLENNGVNLDEERVSASCTTGTTWNGSYCAVNNTPPPAVCSIKNFTANPTSVNKGSISVLVWETVNCTSAKIGGVSVVTTGSKIYTPQTTTTYTLTASNSNNSDSLSRTVIVNSVNPVMSGDISASPTNCKIPVNGSSCDTTISWNTTNPVGTSTVTRTGFQTVASANNNSKRVSIPYGTTSFYLYNSNIELDSVGVSASCTTGTTWNGSYCAVNVNQSNLNNNCSLTSFTVNGRSSDTVDYREKTTLAWTSEYCNSVSVSPYINSNLNVNDQENVYPTSTTIYTITAYGSNGSSDTRTAKVTVLRDNNNDDKYCRINTFRVDDREIEYGDETNLEWETEGCKSVRISNIGSVPRSGDMDISPRRGTSYLLTAYGYDGGRQERSLYVNVVPRDNNRNCKIENFSASQNYINRGNPVTLNWDTEDCYRVNISLIGNVSTRGSRVVYPAGTTNYLLTAYGSNGESLVRSLSVVVNNVVVPPVTPIYNSCAVTTVPTNVTSNSATLNGIVSGSTSGNSYFEYGTSVNLGYRTNTRSIYSGTFSEVISSLSPNTIYYYRLVSDCQGGVSQGSINVFKTLGSSVIRPVIVQGTTVVGQASPIMLKIENRYEAIGKGDTIEYTVTYKNIGKSILRNPILQVVVPDGVTVRNASRGTYQEDTRTLTVELNDLYPDEEGVMYVQGYVTSIQQGFAKIVSTAILVYTNTSGSQENAIAYVLNIPKDFNGNSLGASAFFGWGWLSGLGLIWWLLIIILILIIILLIRRYFYSPRHYYNNSVNSVNPNYPPQNNNNYYSPQNNNHNK